MKPVFYHITREGHMVTCGSLEEAQEALKMEGYLWLDYCNPSKDDLHPLIKLFNLHPLSIEDSTDQEQLPKTENFDTYSFLIFNSYEMYEEEIILRELDAFVGSNFLITVFPPLTNGENFMQEIVQTVGIETHKIAQGPSMLLHLILDKITDLKLTTLETIEEALEQDEEVILSNSAEFNPLHLTHVRRNLHLIRKSLFHEVQTLEKVIKHDSPFLSEKSIVYFRDIFDHLSKYTEMVESARDFTNSLMEMYLSMLNNKMTQAANKTNAIMHRLTVITTIFMPLTLIAGIGGMSEFTMMTGAENWRIAYISLIIAMVIIAIINFILLKRMEKHNKGHDF
jgi:magnesium transporter